MIRWPSRRNDKCLTLFHHSERGRLCSSIVWKFPGFFFPKGARPAYSVTEAFSQDDSSKRRRGLQLKRFQPFSVQLPNMHPNKVIFARDKLPEDIVLPPVAIAPCLTCQHPQPRQQSRYSLDGRVYQLELCVSYAGMVHLSRHGVMRLRNNLPQVSFCIVLMIRGSEHI
jgi:hypothetical protein